MNHWVIFIAHKERGDPQIRFYYLDSSNIAYLDKVDEQLPDLMEKKGREKLAVGILKMPNPFVTKMSIHSLFDFRKAFDLLMDSINGKFRLSQYYTSSSIHNVLKHFHQFTESFNPNSTELEAPKSRMFTQVK